MFFLTRNGFLNHCPTKPHVICQPQSKFDMFTFVISHGMCSILFLLKYKRGENFQRDDQTGMKLWDRCKDILKSKASDSTHENIKKARETITPIVDTKKLCMSKNPTERSQRQHKKLSRSRKSGITNSRNLVEILNIA